MFLAVVGMFAYIAFIPPGPVTVEASGQSVRSEPMVRIDLGEMQKNMDSWMDGWEVGAGEVGVGVGDVVLEEDSEETEVVEEETSAEEEVVAAEEVAEEVYEPESIVEEPALLIDASEEEVEEVNIVEELMGE